jgi:hypothetical protein
VTTDTALVVAETQSLGRSIADLLEAGNLPHRLVDDLATVTPLSTLAARYPLVIVACNERVCATARRWIRGELPEVALVVVGDRDAALGSALGLRVVPLPLRPTPFLQLVEALLRPAGRAPAISST